MYKDLTIFTGNSHRELAEDICRHIEHPLGCAEVTQFRNENIFVRIEESVREQDVFVVQTLSSPVNHSIMELLIMIDALKRASAGRVTAVIPYYAYSRTDKKDQPRVPITARLLADLLTVAGANRVVTVDLHAGQIQGFFNIPVDELTAFYLLRDHLLSLDIGKFAIVAVDIGIAKRARNLAASLKAPLAIIEKRRVSNDDETEAVNVIGDVAGMNVVLFDDEVDTAGSMIDAAAALRDRGARDVYGCCTHPILSPPAIERLSKNPFTKLIVTDTVPVPPHKRLPFIDVLSIAPVIGEAIVRIHTGQSIGAMYELWAGPQD